MPHHDKGFEVQEMSQHEENINRARQSREQSRIRERDISEKRRAR